MADIEKTISIIFLGDDRLGKTITGISRQIDSFASKAQTATQPLADLAESALKLEAALAALAIGGFVYAFKASSDFEASQIELQKVIGDEIHLLDDATKNALTLSDTYGQASKDILAATADWKQAGFTTEEAMKLTKDAMDLVIAGSLDASSATEILISILKGFKAPVDNARVALDILNAVSNQFATDVEQLGLGMAALSPIAKTMGFSMAETAGILTPVIEIFRSGEEAATALKTGLLKLIDDSKPVREALASIGVSQYDANGNLRSGRDILFDVSTAFQTLDQNQKLYITTQLVGLNQSARMVEVFDGLAKSTDITAVALNSAGSAATEVAARLQSAQVAVDRFKVGFENLGIAIGDEFRESAKQAIDGGTAIELALTQLIKDKSFEPIFAEIRNFASRLGADLKGIADAMPGAFDLINWTPFIESIKDLGGEIADLFEAFFGQVDLKTPEGLAIVIQKLVDSGKALTNIVSGILNAWEPFIKALSKGIEAITESDAETQKLVGRILGWAQAVNTIVSNIGLLTGTLTLLGNALTTLATLKIAKTALSFKDLSSAIGGVGGAISKLLSVAAAFGAGWTIGTILREQIPIVRELGNSFGELLHKIFGTSLESIKAKEEAAKYTEQLGAQAVETVRLQEALGELPSQQSTEVLIEGTPEFEAEYERLLSEINKIPDEKDIKVKTAADAQSLQNTKQIITKEVGDTIVLIDTRVDQGSIDTVQEKINEVPTEKILEIKAQGEIDVELARIEAQAETLQSAFEWQAKLEIAEVEAGAQRLTAVAENIDTMFSNTGEVLTGALSVLAGASGYARLIIEEAIEDESRRRDELLVIQKELTEAEIALTKARTQKLESGGGLIEISAAGVYPELELVLQTIIERAQIQANAEGMEFLLGA